MLRTNCIARRVGCSLVVVGLLVFASGGCATGGTGNGTTNPYELNEPAKKTSERAEDSLTAHKAWKALCDFADFAHGPLIQGLGTRFLRDGF